MDLHKQPFIVVTKPAPYVRKIVPLLRILTAFCITTKVTGHAPFFKADNLSTLRTGLSEETVLIFVILFLHPIL